MDAALTAVYLAEIRGECELALQAEKDLIEATKDRRIIVVADEDHLTDEERLYFEKHNADFLRAHINVQAMLTHAAAVSRLLKPGGGPRRNERVRRAAEVGELLDLEDGVPAVLSRTLRDHLEHYDERLLRWSELPGADPMYVWPSRGLGSGATMAGHPLDLSRTYQTNAHQYVFWGEVYDLSALSDALNAIWRAAGNALFKLLEENPWLRDED